MGGTGDFVVPATYLLYTSDAADERSSVDLGGRRIIDCRRAPCLFQGDGRGFTGVGIGTDIALPELRQSQVYLTIRATQCIRSGSTAC